jgi:hypothetical protein
VSEELLALARETTVCVEYLRRPNWRLRIIAGAVVVGMLALLVMLAMSVRMPAGVSGLADVVQGIEAAARARRNGEKWRCAAVREARGTPTSSRYSAETRRN